MSLTTRSETALPATAQGPHEGSYAGSRKGTGVKPRLVIAGAGPIGIALANRTASQWKPIVIEREPDRLADLQHLEGVEAHCGDVTSTLVLKRANVRGASYAVATTGDDEVNLEFCTLMREQFGAHNLVALAHTDSAAEALKTLGATPVRRSTSVAAILESSIDGGRRIASDIGLGEGEICQVTVQSHSPVIGKTLGQLRPQSWLLGAIYREGRLVVPHGSTVIESGDKCLLVGEPSVLQGIADYFQRGSSEFPLQFGTRLCLVEQGLGQYPELAECLWLRDHTEAKGFGILHRSPTPPTRLHEQLGEEVESHAILNDTASMLGKLTDALDAAILITCAEKPGWRDRFGFGNRTLFSLLEHTPEPVMVSRGSHPYKKILVAVSPSSGSLRASELAVDVARKLEGDLTAVGVEPPDFVVGAEYKEQLVRALESVKSTAHMYSRRVDTRLVQGNPVTQVLDLAREFDLLVVAHRTGGRFSLTRNDVSRHLIVNAPCSVMVLPFAGTPGGK